MGEVWADADFLRTVQLRLRLDPALAWDGAGAAALDLRARMEADEELALDAVDLTLQGLDPNSLWSDEKVDALNRTLTAGGSAWEVARIAPDGPWQLARRALHEAREAIDLLPVTANRAGQHLIASWRKLASREVDPTGAYREAVRAVEAVAKPIVLPANDKATLGQMIAAMRDKPDKWKTTLGEVDDVRRLMEIVWTEQLDRHGTDDEEMPLSVSPEQADAAFSVALSLIQLFAAGHIRVASAAP